MTLGNADFEGGQNGGTDESGGWTTTENHIGAVYAEDWGAGAPYLATLNLQTRGNGNVIEQSFLTAEATAYTYASITVSTSAPTSPQPCSISPGSLRTHPGWHPSAGRACGPFWKAASRARANPHFPALPVRPRRPFQEPPRKQIPAVLLCPKKGVRSK